MFTPKPKCYDDSPRWWLLERINPKYGQQITTIVFGRWEREARAKAVSNTREFDWVKPEKVRVVPLEKVDNAQVCC